MPSVIWRCPHFLATEQVPTPRMNYQFGLLLCNQYNQPLVNREEVGRLRPMAPYIYLTLHLLQMFDLSTRR